MKFGCCIGRVDQLPSTRTADLDYLEVSVAGLVMAGDAGAFDRLRAELDGGPPVRAANVFLPSGVHLVGPEATGDDVLSYVREAAGRLGALGVHRLVFGSGGARRIPDGYDRERAAEELAAFCRSAGAIVGDAGITLVLEPLRRAESNVWNSVGEAGRFIRDHDLEPAGVRLLADLYHMREENEPLTALRDHADLLAHTHVAGPGRVSPGDDDAELTEFLTLARQADPDLTCSIECRWTDFATELEPALRALRG